MTKQIVIIDLGTNTFHLLIAEKKKDGHEIVHREKQAVRIGVGGINQDVIPGAGLSRAIETLLGFKRKIGDIPSNRIFTFGTSAFRNARNQTQAINEIKSRTGIEVTILTGNQEAEFIYYGIQSALDMGPDKSLIMDIGGGSVEFIIGDKRTIFWKQSLEIGGQRLLEKFQKHDPIAEEEISQLNAYFSQHLTSLFEALGEYRPDTLVGSSGTFDTLSDIFCLKHGIAKHDDDPETALTMKGFYEIYQELIAKNRAQRMAIPGMIEMRVDMIVVASCLIRFVVDHYAFSKIRVSGYSLKEGALHYLGHHIS